MLKFLYYRKKVSACDLHRPQTSIMIFLIFVLFIKQSERMIKRNDNGYFLGFATYFVNAIFVVFVALKPKEVTTEDVEKRLAEHMKSVQEKAAEEAKKINLPGYLNPAMVNVHQFKQVQDKRKLLWSKPKDKVRMSYQTFIQFFLPSGDKINLIPREIKMFTNIGRKFIIHFTSKRLN